MARNYLTEDQYYNYPIDEAQTIFNLQNPDKEFLDFYFSKPRDLGFFPTSVSQNPAMVDYGIMGTDQANNFQFQNFMKDLEEIGLTPSGKEVGYVGYDPAESMDISIGRKTPQLGDLTGFIDDFGTITARERELENLFNN